eukprot:709835-Pyramimonas_sp.AAC.2
MHWVGFEHKGLVSRCIGLGLETRDWCYDALGWDVGSWKLVICRSLARSSAVMMRTYLRHRCH